MRKTVKKSAHTFKNTFWSNKRVEQNIKIDEIVEYLKLQGVLKCPSAIGMYFTGQQVPQQYVSDAICDMFGVDKTQGWLEFQHAHRAWKAEKGNKTLVKSAKKPYVYKKKDKQIEPEVVAVVPIEDTPVFPTVAITGEELLANRKDIVLRTIYNLVDYDTYKKVESAFEVKL